MIITTKILLKICCANKTFGSYIFIDHEWLFTDWLQRNNYLSVLLTASSVKFQGKLPAGILLWFCIAEISFSGADSQYTLLKGELEVSYVKSNLIRSMPSNDTITRMQFNESHAQDRQMNANTTQKYSATLQKKELNDNHYKDITQDMLC